MLKTIEYVLKQLLTGVDGETHDIGRYLGALAVLVALGLTVYEVVWAGKPFDIQAFGVGIAALFTGLGAVLYLKKDQEPPAKP